MEYLLTKTPLVWWLQSYWRDEAFSIILAQKPTLQLIETTAKDFSPPLYYLVLKIWIFVFGNSEIATRALSVIMFLGLVFITLRFLRQKIRLSKAKTAIVLVLICFSPILTYYAFETRMYSMIAFLSAYSWIALLSGKRKVFVITSALALYSHYSQIFVFASQLLYILIQDGRFNITSAKLSVSTWSREIIAIIISYLPWVIYFIYQHSDIYSQSFWTSKPSLSNLINLPAVLLTGFEKDSWFSYDLGPLTLTIVIFLFTIFFLLYRQKLIIESGRANLFFAFVIWLLVPGTLIFSLAQFGPSLYLPRYMIVSTISIYLVVGYALKRFEHAALYLFLIFFLWQCNAYQNIQIKNRTKVDVAKILTSVNKYSSPEDYLFIDSELDFHLAQVYFKNPDKVYVIGKKYHDLPRYIGKSLIPSSQVFEHEPVGLTGFWFTNNHDIRTIK